MNVQDKRYHIQTHYKHRYISAAGENKYTAWNDYIRNTQNSIKMSFRYFSFKQKNVISPEEITIFIILMSTVKYDSTIKEQVCS